MFYFQSLMPFHVIQRGDHDVRKAGLLLSEAEPHSRYEMWKSLNCGFQWLFNGVSIVIKNISQIYFNEPTLAAFDIRESKALS